MEIITYTDNKNVNMFICFMLCNKNYVNIARMYNNTCSKRTYFYKLKHNLRIKHNIET